MSDTKVLVVTTLYPNSIQFRHGIFVENRIRYLNETGKVNIKVIAPVPWFPFRLRAFHNYSKFVDIPDYELRHGIDVYHCRYGVIPKIGMLLTPLFLAFSLFREIKRLQKTGYDFDVIDAHYYYPDGVAAAMVAKLLKKPLTITARGTDINLIPQFFLPKKMILWASQVANYNLAVCDALRQRMVDIGIKEASTRVLRNGVDLNVFKPFDREAIRRDRSVNSKLLISVGNLIEIKGHHLIIEAMQELAGYELWIVGDGDWKNKLNELTTELNLHDRVFFFPEVEQRLLPEIYNCADALILASEREGWPNVLLEAMACGTPVIASNVGGTSEILCSPEAGILFKDRTLQGIVFAVDQLFANYPDRMKTRAYAENFSWTETTNGLLDLFARLKKQYYDA